MDAGLGRLYLNQLQQPMPGFDERCLTLLTKAAGLSDAVALQLRNLFHSMVGLPVPLVIPPVPVPPLPSGGSPSGNRTQSWPPDGETSQSANPNGAESDEAKKERRFPVILIPVAAAMLLAVDNFFFRYPVDRIFAAVVIVLAVGFLLYSKNRQEAVWPMMTEDCYLPIAGDENKVLDSNISRKEVGGIWFSDSLANAPDNAWDVSDIQNGSVKAWVTTGKGGLYDLHIAGKGGVRLPKDCTGLFANYTHVEEIYFGSCVSTANVIHMSRIFKGCSALTTLDVSGFDTANVTDMDNMFRGCSSLTALDLTGFDTANVKSIDAMFSGCSGLKALNLTNFDTGNVKHMGRMFSGCSRLQSIRVFRKFVIPAKSGNMFKNCPAGGVTRE